MESKNAIIGDDYGTQLPVSQVDDKAINEEKKAAKYSRSSEFKKLREHMEGRIKHYQSFLPDGTPVGASTPTPEQWQVACIVITELQYVIDFYEESQEIVANAEKDK